MIKIDVVVIGSLHHNTLGVVRSLGEAGIEESNIYVLLVGNNFSKNNIITTSKYVKKDNVYYIRDYSEILSWLSKNKHESEPVIICCSDGAAEAVIKSNELLAGVYKSPNTFMPVSQLAVKSFQDQIAEECGLTIPVSADYNVADKIDWELFPCIIKPYKSATGAGKDDVRIIHTRAELDKNISSIKAEKIQIQQFIQKEMEFQLIGCSLDAGENIIIPGFTKLIRQPQNTNTGYLLYSPIDQLTYDKESVEKFIRTIGYSGLFSVEFIRDNDGNDYFLEINMRNDGNAYCVESAGVNLPYIWAYYQTFGNMPDVPTAFKKPVYFIPDFNDLKLAFREIGLFRWLKQFRQAQSHSIYNKKDMGPFRYEFWRQVKRVLNR